MEKCTDNATNNEGLDIFVFSNGQEYTPPRKYHLRNDDLRWWDTTLNYLARSQYGSLHSVIELYTTDGVKIHESTEISSGRAYVAVAPPDPFIDSGYDHYLIKASRSWEKSQMRKLSIQADDTTDTKGTIKTEVSKKSRPPHISVDTTVDKSFARRPPGKNGANSKQIVKKKPLTGQVSQQEHSSVLNKSYSNSYPTTPPSMSAKSNPIKRRQIANRDSKIPKRIDTKMVTPEKNKTTSQTPVTNTVPEIQKEVIGTNSMAGNASFIKTSASNIPQKQQSKDYKILSSLTEDTDVTVISNLYKNMESDIVSTIVDANTGNQADAVEIKRKSTDGPSLVVLKTGMSFQNPNSNDETNGTINVAPEATTEITTQKTNSTTEFSGIGPYTATGNFSPINTTEWLTNFTYQNMSLPTHQLPDGAPQNISSNEHRKDGQFIALTNKGDVVNLSVNIEIKNPEVATQAKLNIDTCKSPLLTEEGVDCNGMCTQSKSVQSLLNDYLPRLCYQDDQNLVYVQCACVDDSFLPDPKALCPEVRTCFVLLPVLTRVGRECCKCKNNEIMKTCTKPAETCTDFQQHKVNISSVKDSAIFMQTDQQESCSNAVPDTPETEFIVNCISKCQVELCSECGGKKINISQTPTSRTTMLSEKKTETVSFQQNKKPTHDVCEMSAQTDWCSTMLEARVNSDGRYTFHLPSIQKIKQYNYL